MPTRLLAAVAALACMLALPAIAAATITTTSVTTPADGYVRTVNLTSGATHPNLTISGTSDASSAADTVDVVCVRQNFDGSYSSTTLASSVATDDTAPHAWSVVTHSTSIDGDRCLLLAMPNGAAFTTPTQLAALHGHRIATRTYSRSALATGPSAGKVWDWTLEDPSLDTYTSWLSSCGLCKHALFSAATGVPRFSQVTWRLADTPGGDPALPLGSSSFGVTVDTYTAFDPPRAKDAAQVIPGFSPATMTFAFGPEDTSTEDYDLVMCNDVSQRHTTLPNTGSCTALVPTGVHVRRVVRVLARGQRVHVADRFTSTDHHSHVLRLQLADAADTDGAGTPLFQLPWLGSSYAFRPDLTTVAAPPSAPWRIQVRASADPVSAVDPVAAMVSSQRPSISLMVRDVSGRKLYHVQTIAVPASGAASYQQGYVTTASAAATDAGADWFEDLFTLPSLSHLKPHSHAHLAAPGKVTVRGVASDARRIAKVTVNGHRAKLRAGGRFSRAVRLHRGKNRVTIRAYDGAGNAVKKTLLLRAG